MKPQSPLDLPCRGCAAGPGEKCGVAPDRGLLRRRIRAGDPVVAYWIRLLPYFHRMRWTDFNRLNNEYAKLADWQKRYPSVAFGEPKHEQTDVRQVPIPSGHAQRDEA